MASIEKIQRIPLRGDLQIIRRDSKSKTILSVWDKKNVITFGAGDILTRLMAPNVAFGADVQEESQIRSMRFGDDNTAPQRTDTILANEVIVSASPVRIQLTDASRIHGSSGLIEFVAVMDTATGNGATYREAGLFTQGTNIDPLVTTGDTMFSRQVFPDQVKTALVELEFRWRITFTV